MNDLKQRIKKSGIKRKELASRCKLPYVTLNLYLNDFIPMPEHIKTRIDEVLKNHE